MNAPHRIPAPETAVEVTTLAGGLRVVTETMPHVRTASVGIWIGAGARDERDDEQGLAHFLEHMAFKGTSTRSAQGIVEAIEAVGGELDAETGVERTAYYARVLGEDLPLALDILADILVDPVFDPEEMRREQGVVLQEIGGCEDAPDELVYDLFMERAYGGQPIGRQILGTPETVRGFDPPALRAYLARHYRAPNMVVAAAGAVRHAEVVEEAERRLARLPREAAPPPPAGTYVGGERRLRRRFEQAHVVLGFEGLGLSHPDLCALRVFSNLLGGGMSSRLFQEVRERRGLCYDIHSFIDAFADTGVLGLYCGTAGEHLAEFMPAALDCLADAAERPGEAEVARAKAQMRVSLFAALERPGRRADGAARQLLSHGRPIPPEEIVARIDAVQPEDVRRVGLALLASPPTLVAAGPLRTLMKAEAIAARLGSAARPGGRG